MIAEYLQQYSDGLKQALDRVSRESFERFVRLLEAACLERHQVFLMGNGGSGSTASHFACDLNKGVSLGMEKRFRAVCLNDNLPMLMAYANDVSYEEVFAEPLKNFLLEGDLVVGISGSGNSSNVIKAIEYANEHGAHTVGLSGYSGGRLAKIVRTSIHVPVNDMQQAEDAHLVLFHAVMQVLCSRMRGNAQPDQKTP